MPLKVTTTYFPNDSAFCVTNIKFGPPDTRFYGIPVYLVSMELEFKAGGTLRFMGLRPVHFKYDMLLGYYARGRLPYAYGITMNYLQRHYWHTCGWLYRNSRMFQPIPPGQVFSWQSFTPIVWAKRLCRKVGGVLV